MLSSKGRLYTGGRIRAMAKETRLSVRLRSELKHTLEEIATEERRSVAQVCEVFLEAGAAEYRRRGTQYLQRLLKSHGNAQKGE